MKEIMVTRSSMPPFEEYMDEIKELWETHWLTNMGTKHNRLQGELTRYLGVENLTLLVNGHMALELGLQALGLKGEVITTPFTFASTTHAIVRNGLKPVFCDIDEKNYTLDCNKLEELITENTSAILPVHVYGNVCEVEKIEKIARKHKLKVIYDAAHAFGVRYKGKGVGTFGDLSVFSFHATKVFNTIEGGAAAFSGEDIGKAIYKLKNFGIQSAEIVDGVGANGKMNEFQAAMGICNLHHIDENIILRKRNYEYYQQELKDIEGIQLPQEQEDVQKNFSYFPILIKEEFGIGRDEVYDRLCKMGIFARKYFYPISSEFECYKELYDSSKTPVALKVSKQVLTLPLYADLQEFEVKYICDSLKQVKENADKKRIYFHSYT